jgi:hypothetical protein
MSCAGGSGLVGPRVGNRDERLVLNVKTRCVAEPSRRYGGRSRLLVAEIGGLSTASTSLNRKSSVNRSSYSEICWFTQHQRNSFIRFWGEVGRGGGSTATGT